MSSFTSSLDYVDTQKKAPVSGLPIYRITNPIRFYSGAKGSPISVLVPAGFETDFASIPWPLRNWCKPTDSRWAKAAVVHDFLCTRKVYCRSLADTLFLEGMLILGAGVWAFPFYWSVKAYGLWKFGRNYYRRFD